MSSSPLPNKRRHHTSSQRREIYQPPFDLNNRHIPHRIEFPPTKQQQEVNRLLNGWENPLEERDFPGLEIHVGNEGFEVHLTQYDMFPVEFMKGMGKLSPTHMWKVLDWFDEFDGLILTPDHLLERVAWDEDEDEEDEGNSRKEFVNKLTNYLPKRPDPKQLMLVFMPDKPIEEEHPELAKLLTTSPMFSSHVPALLLPWGEERMEQDWMESYFPYADFNPVWGEDDYCGEELEATINTMVSAVESLQLLKKVIHYVSKL